jgi:hypothetical protein
MEDRATRSTSDRFSGAAVLALVQVTEEVEEQDRRQRNPDQPKRKRGASA